MHRRLVSSLGSVTFAALAVLVASAAGAEEIRLRKDCGGATPPECFTTIDDVLAEIHERPGNGRTPPGPTHPVVVDIGAGEFELTDTTYPYCDGLSHLSFRGAGKSVSILTGGGYPLEPGFFDAFAPYVVLIRSCSDLDFSNLMIKNKAGVSRSGIRFAGEGKTWWSSVRIVVATTPPDNYPVAWLDSGAETNAASVHHWTDVQAKVTGPNATGWWITGSSHEFRASHILAEDSGSGAAAYGAIFGSGQFELNVEGSLLELHRTSTTNTLLGVVYFSNAAGFYPPCSQSKTSIEGSEIRGSSAATGGTTVALFNACQNFTGSFKARGNNYALTGSAPTRRIQGTGIDAPHDLGAGANPPSTLGPNWSPKGMDLFRETDCGATCLDTSQGSEVHELTFDSSCGTAGPWFDLTTRKCRGL